jgi:hypothetical protein
MEGVEPINEKSTVEWRDVKDLGVPDGDVGAVRKYVPSRPSRAYT